MKYAMILSWLLLLVCMLPAQISNYYTFSATTGTYTTITGTNVPTAIGDNVMSNPIDIGFTFLYGLNSYTQVKINSNGYVTLGTTPGSTQNNFLGSTSYCPVLAPLWDDTYLQGSAQYLLEGSAPTRVFTIQYSGVKWNNASTTSFNYQLKLFENSKVEFIYGSFIGTPINASASIGINMLPGGWSYFYSITPSFPATASTSTENSTIFNWPGEGTIYSFNPPTPVPNDMAALSLTGNQTPSAGTACNYTVAVRNAGTATQTTYSVKLMSGTTELASVAGPAIAPLTNTNVVIPWTPQTPGALAIFGKVVLIGDGNSQNDVTNPINVVVQAAGTTAFTIGDGSQTARKPVDMSYHNSMFETIYQANEITLSGIITGVSFYNNFADNLLNKPTKIWLGMTTQSNLSAGWIPSSQMTQVFNGNVNYPIGQNTITITFNTANPFTYTGGNLVMLVNRPMDTNYYSSANVFQCQTVGTNRSRNAYSDATNYDPNNMGNAGTVSGQFPKTTLYMVPTTTNPVFTIIPESNNYGQVASNQTVSQVFTVSNTGGGSLTISGINLTGSPMFNLQNLPTLPITLNSGQNTTFTAQYAPTTAGTHTGIINITDNLTRLLYTVALSGTCIDPTIITLPYVQAFDAVTVPTLPLDWQRLTTGTGTVTTVTTAPNSAPNCIQMNNSTSPLGPFLISPPLSTTLPVNTLRTKFWAKGAGGFTLSVGIMTNPQDTATFTEIQSVTLTSAWAEYMVDLRTYQGTGHYIAYKHNQGGNNRNIYIDNVLIESLLQNDIAALSITGDTTPNVGTASNYLVTIFNWGLNPQNNYLVKLFKEGDIEVASVAGPNIAGYNQATVTVPWIPTIQEDTYIYGKVVLPGDQNSMNDQTPNYNVLVQASGTIFITVGNGTEPSNYAPVCMQELNSLYENIYMQSELNQAGLISVINFFNIFSDNLPAKPTKIWLGLTTQTDLSAGWIPSTQLTQVFDGNVNYPSGINTITIPLQQPFTLVQGYNLVMLVQRPIDTMSYSYANYFACQTVGTNRARRVAGSATYNPASPPTGTLTGQFPKTGFYIQVGGAGNLTGTVYGADNQPLPDATVQILNGAQTTTNAFGEYSIQNIFASDHIVTTSHHGYYDLTQNVTILQDNTVTLDFTLTQLPTVTVTGTLVGSDAPNIGLPSATISMSGYENYQATANADGVFTITGVYADRTYNYVASAQDYQNLTGSLTVGMTNHDMGYVILNEIAFTPRNVTATISTEGTNVNISWLAACPDSVNVTQGFESDIFPPIDWSLIVTNNGPANTSGVYPTWCRFGEVTVETDVITPTEGVWQAGFWWNLNHQDEWLITPPFDCPEGTSLTFDTNVFRGSPYGDHYYVKASLYNSNNWTVVWDASTQTGGWNHYNTPVTINLSQFSGQRIKLAWHADDSNTLNEGMWFVWFIDNVIVSTPDAVIRFPESEMVTSSVSKAPVGGITIPTLSMSRATDYAYNSINITINSQTSHPTRQTDRSLEGYKVWRLLVGEEQNEANWTLLTPNTISALSYSDTEWSTVPGGEYRWAVKSVYTNNVLSYAAFSNSLLPMGNLAGLVRNEQLVPIMGATVSVGTFSATTAANGSYNLQVPVGTHSATCSAANYYTQTLNDIVITFGQTTSLNFTLTPMGTLAGLVSNQQLIPIMGATVTVGAFSATTAANGTYTLQVPAGTYSVICSAANYNTQIQNDIEVTLGQTTYLNFIMTQTGNEDDLMITSTILHNNYPNPFNPQTTISFDVKEPAPVRIDIYNLKGQIIRTLVNEIKTSGHYTIIWNGKDQNGNGVASGVYHYRMQAGKYKSIRRMLLMK